MKLIKALFLVCLISSSALIIAKGGSGGGRSGGRTGASRSYSRPSSSSARSTTTPAHTPSGSVPSVGSATRASSSSSMTTGQALLLGAVGHALFFPSLSQNHRSYVSYSSMRATDEEKEAAKNWRTLVENCRLVAQDEFKFEAETDPEEIRKSCVSLLGWHQAQKKS